MKLPTQKFVFEISVEAVPHTEETAKIVYGGGYNPDFPPETHASELVFHVLRDSVLMCLEAEMAHLIKCKCAIDQMNKEQREYHAFLEKKTRIAEAVQDSLKFSRVEPS